MKRSSRGRPISAVSSDWKSKVWNYLHSLSSAEAPAGYPYKNSNNRKNRKRAGHDGKREKASLLSSPFPSCPARSPRALSPQPPHNTMKTNDGEFLGIPKRESTSFSLGITCFLNK